MGLGLGYFFRALYLAVTRRRLTSRRVGFYLLFLPLFFLLYFIVWVGQTIDRLLFRSHQAQEIRSPFFIIATPRSGTTLLHRALCLDDKQFTYFRTYQTLLPSISLYQLVKSFSRLELNQGKLSKKVVGAINRQLFTAWKGIHATSMDDAEEDEGLFIYTFFTPAVYLLFPVIDQIPIFRSSDNLPSKQRKRLMAYYKGCLQRFLFSFGKGRTLLSKNVLSTGRLQSLLETFPDARVVYILRHPYEAIPSLLSLFYAVWQSHSPEISKDSPEMRSLARMGFDYYRYLTNLIHNSNNKQFLCIRYEELIADLEGVVEKIYTYFNLPFDSEFQARLIHLASQEKNYQSAHQYSLEDYGLRREVVFSELKDVFEAYGFSR
jgi:hypothetical protein